MGGKLFERWSGLTHFLAGSRRMSRGSARHSSEVLTVFGRQRKTPKLGERMALQLPGQTAPVIIIAIVLVAVFVGSYPIYPRISGYVQIQSSPQIFTVLPAKLERLTIAAASSIQKDRIFFYSITNETKGIVVDQVNMEVSYAGQPLAHLTPLTRVHSGTYAFSVVLSYSFLTLQSEKPNIYYHLKLTVKISEGLVKTVEADVPPA